MDRVDVFGFWVNQGLLLTLLMSTVFLFLDSGCIVFLMEQPRLFVCLVGFGDQHCLFVLVRPAQRIRGQWVGACNFISRLVPSRRLTAEQWKLGLCGVTLLLC